MQYYKKTKYITKIYKLQFKSLISKKQPFCKGYKQIKR